VASVGVSESVCAAGLLLIGMVLLSPTPERPSPLPVRQAAKATSKPQVVPVEPADQELHRVVEQAPRPTGVRARTLRPRLAQTAEASVVNNWSPFGAPDQISNDR
jgi:hypothetical protein